MKQITATANVQLAPVTIASPGPPDTYLGVAESLAPGLRPLANAMPVTGLPLAFLAAHVLECLLKAAITKATRSDQDLKSNANVRHNIVALWALAIANGLALDSSAPEWVENLSRLHAYPYHLRYSTAVHAVTSPAAEPMTTELLALLEKVRDFLRR
jgi:hypothetical protein